MSSNFTEKDSAARDISLPSKNIGCNSTAAAASCNTPLALSMRAGSNWRMTTSRLTSELARISPSAAEPNKISASRSSPRHSIRACEACDSHARTAAGNVSGSLLSTIQLCAPWLLCKCRRSPLRPAPTLAEWLDILSHSSLSCPTGLTKKLQKLHLSEMASQLWRVTVSLPAKSVGSTAGQRLS